MKQILFFLIGITISLVLFLPFANAYIPDGYNTLPYSTAVYETLVNVGNFTYDCANSDGETYTQAINNECTRQGGTWGGISYKNVIFPDGEAGKVFYRNMTSPTTGNVYAFVSGQGDENGGCGISVSDSDGDGLADSDDMYPNDANPYSVKLIGYQTIDGSANGEHVREVYVTDRGDIFVIGADYDESKVDYLSSGPWIDPRDLFGSPDLSQDSQTLQQQITPQQPTYSTEIPTGEAQQGTATGFGDKVTTDGATDQSILLGKINDNLGTMIDNQKRQADYQKDLNAAIANMDRNIALNSQGSTQEDIEKIQDEAEAQAAQNSFDNVSVSDHYSGISGEITEGVDYDAPGDLADESFFTSFFNSNPLITAFSNSGFESTSSSSSMTLNLPGLGVHQLDLIDLQPGLAAFGNLLFAFCSLGSLIMIVRG